MGNSRRRLWGLLVLIVVAPAAFYSVQGVVHRAAPVRSPLPTAVPITTPSAEPRGPTPGVTLAPPVPAPRELDAMAFDAVHNDIVMYGGSGFGSGPDTWSRATWTFDSGGWHLRHPVTGPDIIGGGWMTEPCYRQHRSGRRCFTYGPSARDLDVGWGDMDETRRPSGRHREPGRDCSASCARAAAAGDHAKQRTDSD
jgi:hypothetical protein